MNKAMIRYTIGLILMVTSLLMIPSIAVALIYGEGWSGILPFAAAIAAAGGTGFLLSRRPPAAKDYFAREGFVIVALAWILLSVFGSLPFLLSGVIPNPVNAFFEAASGFTTTGSSVLTDIEALPHSILWWRSFTHWIGGMGVLVFVIAVMPRIDADDVFVMRAEVPGPVFGKVRSRLSDSARILYLIYFAMTVVLIILLAAGGMPVFDSFLHAFGAAGTGGFGIKNNSMAYYNSTYIDYVLAVAMLLFGVNFNLFYLLLMKRARAVFRSEELRWYLGIVLAATAAISINAAGHYDSVPRLLRDVFFTVSSVITTTGYTTANFDVWPVFSRTVLLLLMFCGAMAGSTGGGIKVSRIVIYLKSSFSEIRQSISPNRRIPLTFEHKKLSSLQQRQAGTYLTAYIAIFVLLTLITSFSSPTFITAFSAVAATFNNIGPGLDMVGPAGNYSALSDPATLALSIGMIMGRLEIFPVLVLLSPRAWQKG